jgi:hypothetical protein
MEILHTYKYGTMKPVEVILRRGSEGKKNNGRDEPSLSILNAYMENKNV